MYNLLIGLAGQTSLPGSRMLGHTEEPIRQDLTGQTGFPMAWANINYDRLRALPTLVMPETGDRDSPQLARVGHLSRAMKVGSECAFTFVPNSAIPPIPTTTIERFAADFGIGNMWEFSRTHWAVKDADLYQAVCETSLSSPAKPQVFNLPTETAAEPDLVAVMMPFGAEFNGVYEAIRKGAAAAGMRCLRADDIWEHNQILDDVLSLIWRARVVVADLTHKNPNVLYEAGIAHTIGRDTILAAQNIDDVPFDLRSIRALTYLNNGEGRAALSSKLTERLQTMMSK